MRIKIVKSSRQYKAGETVEVSKNVAFGLIDSGVGVISKDVTPDDYKVTKSDEEQADVRHQVPKVRKNISRLSK